MKIKQKLAALIIIALFLISMISVVSRAAASPRTINVYENESIQQAIDLASPGDTVVVNSGIYYQAFTVNKPLTIQSIGAILDLTGTSYQTAIIVVSSGVTISGFEIRNIPAQVHAGAIHFPVPSGGIFGGVVKDNIIDSGFYGIVLNGPSNIEIRNNSITAVCPIYVINSPNVNIKDNTVSAHALNSDQNWLGSGITLMSEATSGKVEGNKIDSTAEGFHINFVQSPIEIENNVVYTSFNAFSVYSGRNIAVKNNVFYASDSGISLTGPNMVVIGNEVHCSQTGISINGINPIVKENKISNPTTGITLYGASNAQVSFNQVEASFQGIQISSGTNVLVEGNLVTSGKMPIWLADSPGAVVRENTVFTSGLSGETFVNGITFTSFVPGGGCIGGIVEKNKVTSDYRGIAIDGISNTIIQSDILVRENIIYRAENGIEANYATNTAIINNLIYADNGIIIGGGTTFSSECLVDGNEIYAVNFGISAHGSNTDIVNNKIYRSETGITVSQASDIKIENNTISGNRHAVHISYTSNVEVSNNFAAGEVAIRAYNAPNTTVKDNLINTKSTKPTTSDIMGISFEGVFSGGLIRGNEIDSEFIGILSYGIFLLGPSNIEILNNTIYHSTNGIDAARSPNVVVKNNVVYATALTPNQAANGIVLGGGGGNFANGIVEGNIVSSINRGISVGTIPNIHVDGNEILTATNGIEINGAFSGGSITNNMIFTNSVKNGIGIWITQASDIEIRNNSIYSSTLGIEGGTGSKVSIIDNVVFADPGTNNPAIRTRGNYLTLTGNFINSTGHGVNVNNFDYAIVQGNTINASGTGINSAIPPTPPGSIVYWQNPRIIDNFINGTQIGITAIRFKDGIIQNNLINTTARIVGSSTSGSGINLSGESNQVIGNTIKGTFQFGINLNGMASNTFTSYHNVFSDNIIVGGAVTGDTGIYLNIATSISNILRNTISGVDVGMFFNTGAGSNLVTENTIQSNTIGVRLLSSGSTFYHNNFLYNTVQVDSISATNTWDNGYPSGGNYWSDYTGPDNNHGVYQDIPGHDGIGDTPYVIDVSNRDQYPLMTYWPVDITSPYISITQPLQYSILTEGSQLVFSATDIQSGVDTVVGHLTDASGNTINVQSGYAPFPGVYTLVVEAKDKAGNVALSDPVFFVVYDPNGGFATGNGWFYPDEVSTLPGGKARFGFEVKYKDSTSAGNLQFVYKDADVDLRSTSIDWLVIAGSKVMFQGTASINNQGTYTFRVTAVDNGNPGKDQDTFSITIWQGNNTEPIPFHKAENAISTGNIMVKKK